MFKKHPIWIRAVEGAESGGSAGASGESETGNAEDSGGGSDEDGQDGEVDWKARYEQAQQEADKWKAHSRKWEKRAQAKGDSDDDGDVRVRLGQVEEDLAEARAENLRLSIGAEFGLAKDDVDDFLHGTEEDMRRQAKRLKERAAQSHPENAFQGRGSRGNSKEESKAWASKLLGRPTNT